METSSPMPGCSQGQPVKRGDLDDVESGDVAKKKKQISKTKDALSDSDDEENEQFSDYSLSEISDDEEKDKRPKVRHHSDGSSCGSATEMPYDKEIEELLNSMSESNNKYDWTTIAVRSGLTSLLYPSQMAQILMQMGYEPYPPRVSMTLLGRPCLLLPSTGAYLRYIYQVDGLRGIFHGLTIRTTQQLIFTYMFERTRGYFRRQHVRAVFAKARAREITENKDDIQNGGREDSDQSESDGTGFLDHCRDLIHELQSKLTAIVVSYPLQVVVIRTIAQFVGRENSIRTGIFSEVRAIYSDFGLLGFYRGLVPKLIGESCQTLAVGALAFFVSNQAPTQELRSLLNMSFSILVSAWTYQFSVVSTTMAVNGSCLKAGQPPMQTVYENWIQCWRDLKSQNLLNRGSSIICRYYTGPTLLVNGVRQPIGVTFGPNHLVYKLK